MGSAKRGNRRHVDGDGQTGPLRQCAVTRSEMPADDLIRFVAAPDGAIIPDLSRRLPGRGVWISGDKDTVAAAVKGKIFGRSLKRAVSAPEDLADRVDDLLSRRALDALSLANKAGTLVAGFAKVEAAAAQGSVVALLHATNAAEDGCHKLDRKCRAANEAISVPFRKLSVFSIEEMSLAIGRPNVVHAALLSGGATERFVTEAGRMLRYRSGSVASGSA